MEKQKESVLIIGAGAAGSVVAKKCAKNRDVFKHITLASRHLDKCRRVQEDCSTPVDIKKVDADDTQQVIDVINDSKADLVINMALPYHDLPIMDACLETKTDYIDTANYEPKDEAKFCYKWQWDYHEKFKERNIMALLGCGFDPGVTNVFCAYANKELFDEIHHIDIIDCNAGEHGHPFATNFNPEINIREITQPGKYYENGEWIEIPPLSLSQTINFPEIGPKKAYLLYHEELESLVKHIPSIKNIRFWMTFSESYLTHLKVLQNVGITSIEPINFEGKDIVPLQFLKQLLPDPSTLGINYKGKTCIGCKIKGIKNNSPKEIFIYNISEHEKCYDEFKSQAVSYTTGIPASLSAMLMMSGLWHKNGVYNIEQMDPIPFMEQLSENGLPWVIEHI